MKFYCCKQVVWHETLVRAREKRKGVDHIVHENEYNIGVSAEKKTQNRIYIGKNNFLTFY